MKRFVCALLLIMLLPLTSALAQTAENPLWVDVLPHQADISFVLSNEEYAYVTVTTQKDVIKTLLYSEDGSFFLSAPLNNCFDATPLTVEVFTLSGKRLMRYNGNTLAVEDQRTPSANLDPSVRAAATARDVVITMVEGGFDYSFNVPGRDSVILRYKTAQETHNVLLYAADGYTYEGHAPMLFSFPDDRVTITLLTVNSGHELYQGTSQAYFAPLPIVDQAQEGRLKGVTVCVDPGHQRQSKEETVPLGPNFKKQATTTFGMAQGKVTARRESIVVLEIGLQLRNALLSEGANVIMTREVQDTFVGMLERADIPNNANADFVLRLHCNSRDNDQVQGIVVYCPYQSSYAMEVAPEDVYREMGFTLLYAMQEATGQAKGTCTLNNTYVGNNWSMMPSFLVEMGYLSNRAEDLLMSASPLYQQQLVQGMVEGIVDLSVMRGLIEAPAAE